MSFFSSVSNSVSSTSITGTYAKPKDCDFKLYTISDISLSSVDFNEEILDASRWSESLFDSLGPNTLDILTLGLPKLIVGSRLHHEFLMFRTKNYVISLDFVFTSSIVMKISKLPSFVLNGRKDFKKKTGDEDKIKPEMTLYGLKKLCKHWLGKKYHITKNNCQKFCEFVFNELKKTLNKSILENF